MKRSTKDQLLINKQESRVLQHLNDSKTFIRFSNDIDDIYKSTEGYIYIYFLFFFFFFFF